MIKPTELITKLFYNNDVQKASWEAGRYSAEVALTSIYKVFVLIATPQFIIKRGSKILSSFYDPSTLVIGDTRAKGVDVHITEFPQQSVLCEYRIAGWMEQALEICGAKNLVIHITESLVKGDEKTVFVINWD